MARITINDCLTKVNNHFELVLIASVRAKELLSGKNPNIPREGSTVGVIALREIAEVAINVQNFKARLPVIFGNEDESSLSNNSQKNVNEGNIIENDTNKLLVIEEADGNNLLSSD